MNSDFSERSNSPAGRALNAARALVRRVVVHGRSVGSRLDNLIRDRLNAMSGPFDWKDDAVVESIARDIVPFIAAPASRRDTAIVRVGATQRL